MFGFSNKSNQKEQVAVSSEPTRPMPMSEEERMAFRREMMFQTIRQCMKTLEVNSNMYRFKVMNIDSRHHRFLAMIEVTNTYEAKMDGVLQAFSQVEEFIQKTVFDRFDIVLDGIFWRVREKEKSFERKSREGDKVGQAHTSSILAATQPAPSNTASQIESRLSRANTTASLEELQAFRNALLKGGYVPGLHSDGKVYVTEPTPLDEKPATGGTQYGHLDEGH
jgi:hypothetical protein